MILHEIFRVVSSFPCYISCYITEKRISSFGQCMLRHFLSIGSPLPQVVYTCKHGWTFRYWEIFYSIPTAGRWRNSGNRSDNRREFIGSGVVQSYRTVLNRRAATPRDTRVYAGARGAEQLPMLKSHPEALSLLLTAREYLSVWLSN